MDQFAAVLQSVGHHAHIMKPMIPTYLLLISSAIFPIYTGAHASLMRPPSAAKPSKRRRRQDSSDSEEDEENDLQHGQEMEGLGPMDAITLPLLAGSCLAGLYHLIKWLEDPALLNKILNWYFSLFGVVALARFLTDGMRVLTSFFFPSAYGLLGEVWEVHPKDRRVRLSATPSKQHDSPLPGIFALIPLPSLFKQLLWILRELPSRKLRIKAYIHNTFKTNFTVGPQGVVSLLVAIAAELYFNLVAKPWWLTNILGFSFVYASLQVMSPSTAWTGTLILCALFCYDIIFVFYTPLMVTVATQLDIPAKLLFPRPSGPDEDPTKQALSLLGLGDLVLPGILIGFALRFDLYLFYLRKQTRGLSNGKGPASGQNHERTGQEKEPGNPTPPNPTITKAKFHPATSFWGERFWLPRHLNSPATFMQIQIQGTLFPKPYFRATLTGYILGMLCTLLIMQIYSHAQPALLYLVPGVLGALWGTAFVRGEAEVMWGFHEGEEGGDAAEAVKEKEEKEKEGGEKWGWGSWFLGGGRGEGKRGDEKDLKDLKKSGEDGEEEEEGSPMIFDGEESLKPRREVASEKRPRRRKQLVSFSISLPDNRPSE